MEEVEVNLEGQWRPEGRGGRWHHISEEPAPAATALALQVPPPDISRLHQSYMHTFHLTVTLAARSKAQQKCKTLMS